MSELDDIHMGEKYDRLFPATFSTNPIQSFIMTDEREDAEDFWFTQEFRWIELQHAQIAMKET